MRLIKMIVIFLGGLLFLGVKDVRGATPSCDFSHSMDGSTVTFNVSNCTTDGSYLIAILKDGNVVQSSGRFSISGRGNKEVPFVIGEAGEYKAQLTFGFDVIVGGVSFSVEEDEIVPLNCDDLCPRNSMDCPGECPSLLNPDGKWYCNGHGPEPTAGPLEAIELPKYPVPASGKWGMLGDLNKLKVGGVVSNLLPYVYVLAGLGLLVMLIAGGIGLMTGGGDPGKTKASYGKIVNAVIGFLIVFISYFVVQLVEVILGVKIL